MNLESVFHRIDTMLLRVRFDEFNSWKKEDGSYVTNLDLLIQEQVTDIVLGTFDKHRILAEEGEQRYSNVRSDYTWVIDPIDGTNNFVNGKKEYAVSVGVMHRDRFIAAYVRFPAIDETYFSIYDSGVLRNGKEWKAQNTVKEDAEVVLCSRSFLSLSSYFEGKGYKSVCYTCAVYSMLQVLKRNALLYYAINTNIYDVGPMSYILNNSNIYSYDERNELMRFKPELQKIPVFVLTSAKYLKQILDSAL